MLLPVVAYYLLFHYGPMYGVQIAFRDFNPAKGIWGSPWVGLQYFKEFFNGFYFSRVVLNALLLNILALLLGFPAPIILALLLNEIRSSAFKRTVQTITYMPHFISLVVVVGMLVDFLARDGLINNLLGAFVAQPTPYLQRPEWFRAVFVGSDIWQHVGWGSIIYLAALSNIDPTLYEAAMVDGAGRFRQLWHITLPGIAPTIIILLILRMGAMMSVGYEKIILMYNPMTYETADVISTYVYRKGILETSYSYSIILLLVLPSPALRRRPQSPPATGDVLPCPTRAPQGVRCRIYTPSAKDTKACSCGSQWHACCCPRRVRLIETDSQARRTHEPMEVLGGTWRCFDEAFAFGRCDPGSGAGPGQHGGGHRPVAGQPGQVARGASLSRCGASRRLGRQQRGLWQPGVQSDHGVPIRERREQERQDRAGPHWPATGDRHQR